MQTINSTLEAEYNNRTMVPEHPAIFERWRRDSAQLRTATPCTLDISYSGEPLTKLDLFHAKNSRGSVVFIHGGYWRSLDKSDFSFVAKPFIDAGLDVALINYRLCPTVSIDEIASDCRQALAWIIDSGSAHNISVNRIVLAGHSAGAHLVAMLYSTDWSRLRCDVSNVIGGIGISGVYDLEPLLQCSMNVDLQLNHCSARANSPFLLLPTLKIPLYLAAGSIESSAFQAQSRLLAGAWPDTCETLKAVENANHFTVLDCFAQPTHATFVRALEVFD